MASSKAVAAPLFRTIMSYECASGCPRIDYWSNPNVAFSGIATGAPHDAFAPADNASTLNLTGRVVANYRPPRFESPPNLCERLLLPSYHHCRPMLSRPTSSK